MPANHNQSSYSFQVDLLVQGQTDESALESLLKLLKGSPIVSYRITGGAAQGAPYTVTSILSEEPDFGEAAKPAAKPAARSAAKEQPSLVDRLQQYKSGNTLIRLSILRGRGIKWSLPCRILNYDTDRGSITVYHVDEKKVYSFDMSEIEDLTIG